MSFSNLREMKKKKQTLLKGKKNYEMVKEIAIFKSLIFTNPIKGSFQKGRFHKKCALEK